MSGETCSTYYSTTEPLAVVVAENYASQDLVVRNESLGLYGGQSLMTCSSGDPVDTRRSYANQDFWVHVARAAGRDVSFVNDFVSKDFHLSWAMIDEVLANEYGYTDGLEDQRQPLPGMLSLSTRSSSEARRSRAARQILPGRTVATRSICAMGRGLSTFP